jgi:putative nucleotidyltransferase with HDIG domain
MESRFMLVAKQNQTPDIDFQQFERLLFNISRLVHISLEIKNLEGETIACSCKGVDSVTQGAHPEGCGVESFDLLRKIENSGNKTVKQSYDNIETLGIPLIGNSMLVGILYGRRCTDKGNVSDTEIDLLEEIAERISGEIQGQLEVDSLANELSNRYEELNLVYDIGRQLYGMDTAEKAIEFIIEQSREPLNTDIIIASVPCRNIHVTNSGSTTAVPFDIEDKSFMNRLNALIMKRLDPSDLHPAHVVINEDCDDKQLADLFSAPLEMLVAPVRLQNAVSGCLYIINADTNRHFHTGGLKLVGALAEQITLVLTNSVLYQNLKDFLLSVVRTLVSSIEAKDPYTRGHSERVSKLAMMIADVLGFSPDEKEMLNWAALLHDIGKIGVPGKILNKEGKLTKEEFLYIKEHPDKGFRILRSIEQLRGSLSAIFHHHERYDGNGYPLGLRGKEIPLHARMIAIADTYDAMTSRRSYRSNISHEDAIDEMVRVKGKQLDPELVEIFINLDLPSRLKRQQSKSY